MKRLQAFYPHKKCHRWEKMALYEEKLHVFRTYEYKAHIHTVEKRFIYVFLI